MTVREILERLEAIANPVNVAGMARFGINPSNTLGISVADLRRIAREIGSDHELARELWQSAVHEARIVAGLIDAPRLVTEEQMETWGIAIDSWDICDLTCNNLFRKTPFAYARAREWAGREEEFVKRAGFVLMATLAVHDKHEEDDTFRTFLSLVEREAGDERNFVKKAVNWALRQIGKRNPALRGEALEVGRRLVRLPSKSARWIGRDAIRELESPERSRAAKE